MRCAYCVGRNFDGKFLVDRRGNAHLPGGDLEGDIQRLLDQQLEL